MTIAASITTQLDKPTKAKIPIDQAVGNKNKDMSELTDIYEKEKGKDAYNDMGENSCYTSAYTEWLEAKIEAMEVWEGSKDYPFKADVKEPISSNIIGTRIEGLDENGLKVVCYIKD